MTRCTFGAGLGDKTSDVRVSDVEVTWEEQMDFSKFKTSDWLKVGGAAGLGGKPGAVGFGKPIRTVSFALGGRLMRTVSFFGWTLEASAGFGGTGVSSDILSWWLGLGNVVSPA